MQHFALKSNVNVEIWLLCLRDTWLISCDDAHWPRHSVHFWNNAAAEELHGLPLMKSGKEFQSFCRNAYRPRDTYQCLFHHTNPAAPTQVPHKHGPTTRPQEWRWPNKARPHIMRSDSLLQRERPGLPPRLFSLAFLQLSEWLSPSDTPWQLDGSWKELN